MICSEGLVENSKFRVGDLNVEDCTRLAQAIGTLSTAPIYIDDTAGIGISEIRAKCRRLAQSEKGLGLIVIDHIQLMQSGRKSRQQTAGDFRNLAFVKDSGKGIECSCRCAFTAFACG